MSMNRAQRRAAKKAAPKKKPIMHNLTKQERLERICQNGITPNDLKKEYDEGFHAGYIMASDDIIKACYAGVCIALNELHGFGEKQMRDVLRKLDNLMMTRITGEDMIQEVMDRFGFRIDFRMHLTAYRRWTNDQRQRPAHGIWHRRGAGYARGEGQV